MKSSGVHITQQLLKGLELLIWLQQHHRSVKVFIVLHESTSYLKRWKLLPKNFFKKIYLYLSGQVLFLLYNATNMANDHLHLKNSQFKLEWA